MAFPPGVTTCSVTFGQYTDFAGNPLEGSVYFVPSTPLKYDGQALFVRPVEVKLVNGSGSVALPHVDQAGFTGDGGSVTLWTYAAVVRFRGHPELNPEPVVFQVTTGQSTFDLEDVVSIPASPGVEVPNLVTQESLAQAIADVDQAIASIATDLTGKASLGYVDGVANNLASAKVDKVSGKGLSTNDYTTTEKTNLATLVTTVPGKVDKGSLRINVADYASAVAAVAAAPAGSVVYFPPGTYVSPAGTGNGIVVPADNITIEMSAGAEIQVPTWGQPGIDCLNRNGIRVIGKGVIRYTGTRGDHNGSIRGGATYTAGAGVYINGDRCEVNGLRVIGMPTSVYLSSWDGSSIVGHRGQGNIVRNLECEGMNFGVLYTCQDNLTLENIFGHDDIDDSSGTNPTHVIYCSATSVYRARGITVSNLSAARILYGQPFQWKFQDSGTFTGLVADASRGLMNLMGCADLELSGLVCTSSKALLGAPHGAITVQDPTTARVKIRNVTITTESAGYDQRLLYMLCTDGMLENVQVVSKRVSTTNNGVGIVQAIGDRMTVRNISCIETGSPGVGLLIGDIANSITSNDVLVEGVRATGVVRGVDIYGPTTGSVRYQRTAIVSSLEQVKRVAGTGQFDVLRDSTLTVAGSPEGVTTAPVGTIVQRSDGTAGTSAYIKESGTGNTGWRALADYGTSKVDKTAIPISVLDYGADRTGVANSTSAFSSALSASSSSGRPVSVPAGIYKIDPDTLTIPKALIGEGMDLVSLRSTGAANTGVGLAMPNAYTEVSGVELRGFKAGIKVTNHSTRVFRNKLSYNLIGIDYDSNSFLGRCVGNNIIFNNAIGVKIGNLPYQLLIAHNIIDNNNGIGVAMHGGSNGAVIVDNSIEGNRKYSDSSNLGCGVLITGTYQSRLKIDGNWFEANGETSTSIDVAMRGPDTDTASNTLINDIVSNLVPSEYQSLFSGRVLGGAVSIAHNAFVFTQYGLLGTMGAVGALSVRNNSFKGVKGKYNKHIYLTLQSNYCGRVKIEDNSWKNTDDVTIDPEVETGVGGTIVHSNLTTGDLPIMVEGKRLFAGPDTVQVFTSSGTFNKVYGAVSYDVTVISGGSGGGSGRRGAAGSVRCGGGGGGAGGMSFRSVPASAVGSTETVTVGAGGAGGAAVTADDTNGNNGAAGGMSSFGTHVRAQAPGAGGGGTASAGTAGGAGMGTSPGGAGGAASGSGGAGAGGSSGQSATGGGAGGGISSGNTPAAGGAGGFPPSAGFSQSAGGAVDASATAASGAATGNPIPGSGGGGGGGSITGAAGNGANGSKYGAGGGGGGASLNGNNSGAGGNGADGIVVVVARF